MGRRKYSKLILISLFFLTLFPQLAFSQFVCGSTNVFEKNISWMRDFAKNYGFASLVGNQEIQCGMVGEDFRLCRKCERNISSEQLKILQPMVSAEKYRSWLEKWRTDMQLGSVSLNLKDFESEKKMGHVRPQESRDQFESRVNANWGESFFFLHRELYKMVQFELTMSGQPCFGPLAALPTKWNDSNWPTPKGKASQDLLNTALSDLKVLEDPKNLKKMNLNQLGLQTSAISKNLYLAYQEPKEALDKKCQGDESVSKTCDNLMSAKSSQVNKNFWMIHAYFDSMVGKWLKANDFEEIAKDCAGKKKCYQWNGTYTANYPI